MNSVFLFFICSFLLSFVLREDGFELTDYAALLSGSREHGCDMIACFPVKIKKILIKACISGRTEFLETASIFRGEDRIFLRLLIPFLTLHLIIYRKS